MWKVRGGKPRPGRVYSRDPKEIVGVRKSACIEKDAPIQLRPMHHRTPLISIAITTLALGACSSPPSQHVGLTATPPLPTRAPATEITVAEPAPPPQQIAAPVWRVVGASSEGRPIEMQTLGRGHRSVLLIGSIHGDETEGLAGLDTILDAARPSFNDADVTLHVVRDLNPDGSHARRRTNARGVDLNRNFPATNFRAGARRGPEAGSEPETRVLLDVLARTRPELIIVLHATRRATAPFVNYDGPSPVTPDIAIAFADAALEHDPRWSIVPDMGYPTPGSLGSYAGDDLQIPTLTIEFRKGDASERVHRAAGAGLHAVLTR